MKQKRTARGHLCVTHEVKAKHDLSSDVCMISASKFGKQKHTTWKVNTFERSIHKVIKNILCIFSTFYSGIGFEFP